MPYFASIAVQNWKPQFQLDSTGKISQTKCRFAHKTGKNPAVSEMQNFLPKTPQTRTTKSKAVFSSSSSTF